MTPPLPLPADPLFRLGLPEHAPVEQLQALTRVASVLTGAPYAAVNLLDDCFQHQIAPHGVEGGRTSRDTSMCALAVRNAQLRYVPDARLEPAFAANPWVDGRLAGVRFYASAPLLLPDGTVLGTLCVFDLEPRTLTEDQQRSLTDLAGQAVALLERAAAERAAVRSGALMSAVLDTMDVGVVACDADGRLTMFNGAARRFHGAGADSDLDFTEWADRYRLLREDGRTPLAPEEIPLLRALRESHVEGVLMVIAADGQAPRTVTCEGRDMRSPDGELLGAVVTLKDVTALQRSEQRFRAAFYDGPTPMARLDEAGTVLEANPALRRLLGLPSRRLLDLPLAAHLEPEDLPRYARALEGTGTGAEPIELRAVRADGSVLWCELGSTRGPEPDGNVSVLVQLLDVSDRKAHELRLENAALVDPLTRLANRTALDRRLAEVLDAGSRRGTAVFFLDLDGFKAVNDSYGHEAGDAVLVEVAARLQRCMREGDLVARLGGDEFVVLASSSEDTEDPRTAAEALRVPLAQRLQAAMDTPFAWGEHVLDCRASVGSCSATPGEDPRLVLTQADVLMYHAKARRRGQPVPAARTG